MRLSRRGLLSNAVAPMLVATPLLLPTLASADSAQYLYDALGRLVRVTLPDGTVVIYDYDAAGNRIRQVRGSGTTAFNQTLQVTGTGPINLRTVADQAGYTGLTDATIIFQVGSAITIMGGAGSPNGGAGIDTGLWPSSTKAISLTLQVSGKVYGGGGMGGGGGSGGLGGDALYCRENFTVVVNSGGQIKGGGGGGGKGGGWSTSGVDGEGEPWGPDYSYGGGGGGGFPNGPGGYAGGPGGTGAAGTTSGGGAGGGAGGPVTHTCGAGGVGGAAATTGATGASSTGSAGGNQYITWTGPESGSPGGGGGYAIRKNGKTVPVTNNGTITGTQG